MSQESSRQPASHAYAGYWDRAQWPLQGLYFLLPLLVFYELGTWMLAPEEGERLAPILAESILAIFFRGLGVTGVYLPALIVVAVLLCMHLVRRDPWSPEPKLYGVMWVETFAWALPLFIFSIVLVRELGSLQATTDALTASATTDASWKQYMVFSVGAGIYEELLFRLIGIALLHMLLVDVLALPEKPSGFATIVLSALAFAIYHFVINNNNPDAWVGYTIKTIDWGNFAFFTLAGVYLGMIYVIRGFGLVVGTHALYDVMVIWHNYDLTHRLLDWIKP